MMKKCLAVLVLFIAGISAALAFDPCSDEVSKFCVGYTPDSMFSTPMAANVRVQMSDNSGVETQNVPVVFQPGYGESLTIDPDNARNIGLTSMTFNLLDGDKTICTITVDQAEVFNAAHHLFEVHENGNSLTCQKLA